MGVEALTIQQALQSTKSAAALASAMTCKPAIVRPVITHEAFIAQVRECAIRFYTETGSRDDDALTVAQRLDKLAAVKMVYGRGTHGLRGVTVFNAWKHTEHTDFIEICALGEESWIQLAGTTLHELAHAFAGWGAAHGKEWKAACAKLGLRRVHAAGTQYLLANFHPFMRAMLYALAKPCDGMPSNAVGSIRHTKTGSARVCTAGIGTKGGKSRGVGSGSRLRKYVCPHGQIVRASTDELNATCNVCGGKFEMPEE